MEGLLCAGSISAYIFIEYDWFGVNFLPVVHITSYQGCRDICTKVVRLQLKF